MIEAAAWAKPILSGPSLFNFATVSQMLIDADAMQVVATPADLAQAVGSLQRDLAAAEAMGQRALQVAEANRGALDRLLALIDKAC